MKKILVIHGPNLNLLGKREPDVYGKKTLEDINTNIQEWAKKKNIEVSIKQSNHEGEIVDLIGKSEDEYNVLIINPAAYTHTSVAIRDAISAIKIPIPMGSWFAINARTRPSSLVPGALPTPINSSPT